MIITKDCAVQAVIHEPRWGSAENDVKYLFLDNTDYAMMRKDELETIDVTKRYTAERKKAAEMFNDALKELEAKGYNRGAEDTLADAKAGRYAQSEEIYNKEQVKSLIADAVKAYEEQLLRALKKQQSVYRLPGGAEQLLRDVERSMEGGYGG